jgi:hypothetical protein
LSGPGSAGGSKTATFASPSMSASIKGNDLGFGRGATPNDKKTVLAATRAVRNLMDEHSVFLMKNDKLFCVDYK